MNDIQNVFTFNLANRTHNNGMSICCLHMYVRNQMYVIVNDDPRGATQYFYNHN